MKKAVYLFLVLLLPFTFYLSPTSLADFKDVSFSHVNYDAINYVEDQGIVSGYSDGSYKPDDQINRAEFLKIIVESQFDISTIDSCLQNRAKEGDLKNYVYLKDVKENIWYAKYVCVAMEKGIINGYTDGTFQGSNLISFVEAAKIVVNAFQYPVTQDIELWYRPYVKQLEDIKASPDTIDSLEKKITRGEVAEIIYRILADDTTKGSTNFITSDAVSGNYDFFMQSEDNVLNTLKKDTGLGFSSITAQKFDWIVQDTVDMYTTTFDGKGFNVKNVLFDKVEKIYNFFKTNGFSEDTVNMADGTVVGSVGYTLGTLACKVRMELVDQENIDTSNSNVDVSCAYLGE